MKRTVFLIFSILFLLTNLSSEPLPVAPYLPGMRGPENANAPITVQYPFEKMKVAAGAKKIFLFGKINLPDALLDINGERVALQKNGTFITYLPVDNGEFTFLLNAVSGGKTYQATRTVVVPGKALHDFLGETAFDEQETYPKDAIELLPGDVLDLSVRGTPGTQVSFTIPRLKKAKDVPMKEDVSNPGVYRAKYLIDEDESPRTVRVAYKMENGPAGGKARITANGRVRILDKEHPFTTAQITNPGVKVRKIPTRRENLFPYYRAYGEVLLNGLSNGLYRIQLNEREAAWLSKNNLKITRNKNYQANVLSSLRATVEDPKSALTFEGSKQVPVSVQEFNDRMELIFYYTDKFEENFSIDTTSPIIDSITWSNTAPDTILFKINFKKDAALWGHSYRYDKNAFILDLMHKPVLTPTDKLPLKGARILLDAGHSPKRTPPYDGAVGPTGSLEYEVNLALAEDVKPRLEALGAEVIMTRQGGNRMSLNDRYRHAVKNKAHIFVSIHYNALPETVNPFSRPRGYVIYYTYPHSFKLAESVYESFNRNVKQLPDNGMIANDILFIPRIPEMPTILIENAFLILPEQEQMAISKEGRKPFADAIFEGILNFYGVQKPKPAAAKKPAKKRTAARRRTKK